jgi:hypothetical protein
MNKLFGFFVILFFLISFSNAEQNFTIDSMEVSVDIPATQEWAEIELNTASIDFGSVNVTGSLTDKRKSAYYEIRNRGNTNITVTPVLAAGSDDIFDNLKFSKLISDSLSTWRFIGNYSIDLNATSSYDWSIWHKYSIRLDLTDYLGSGEIIPFDINNYKKTVVFEVMPRYG